MNTLPDFQPPPGFTPDDLFCCDSTTVKLSRSRKRRRKYGHQKRRSDRLHFMMLSPSVRREKTVSLGWRIRSDPNGLGVFTTHQVIPGSKEWPLEPFDPLDPSTVSGAGWADFLFLSRKHQRREGIFYNAYAKTVGMEMLDRMERLAEDAAQSMLSADDLLQPRMRAFSRKILTGSNRGGSEMVFAPAPAFAALGGMTIRGFEGQWLLENLDRMTELLTVHPNAELDRDYSYGLGLHLLVRSHSLTVASIATEVAAFLDRGECAYRDEAIDLAPYLAAARRDLEITAYGQLRMDARDRDMPDPTPPHVAAAYLSSARSVPIRMEIGQCHIRNAAVD